jgi:lipid II:glycine glycyltransferase (peptidoglycan interpeptide bridge formation enzyme)
MQYPEGDTLLDGLENNTKRFVKILSEAADDTMPIATEAEFEEDIYDILYDQVCIAMDKSLMLLASASSYVSQCLMMTQHAASKFYSVPVMQRKKRLDELQAQGQEVRG